MEKRMKPVLLAAFNSRDRADRAIEDLEIEGFSQDCIGLIAPEVPSGGVPGHDLGYGGERQPVAAYRGEAAVSDVAGAALEERTGKFFSLGNVVQIPGAGAFAAFGFFVRASGSTHWLASCLAGTDLTPVECGHFERQAEVGKTLVGVLPEGRVILASEILRRYGGELSRERSHVGRW